MLVEARQSEPVMTVGRGVAVALRNWAGVVVGPGGGSVMWLP